MVMSHKQARCHRPEAIRYDNSNITETTVYKHLGGTQSSHGKQPYNVDQVKKCIRGTYSALATLVAGQDGANPLTLCKLYSLSVLPKALFGCEPFLLQNTRYQNWILCKAKNVLSDSLCAFIMCSTSAKRVTYFLGYVDAALECNIQVCKYPDVLSVTAKYLRRIYSCYDDCL